MAAAEPKHGHGEEEEEAEEAAAAAAGEGERVDADVDADDQEARCTKSLGASGGSGGGGRGITRKREAENGAESPGGAESVATKAGSCAEGTPDLGGGGSSPKRARTTGETSSIGAGDGGTKQKPPPPPWRGPLNIVTWNLNGAGPRLSKDWHGIADLLRAEKADVVFFQEVWRGERWRGRGFWCSRGWVGVQLEAGYRVVALKYCAGRRW